MTERAIGAPESVFITPSVYDLTARSHPNLCLSNSANAASLYETAWMYAAVPSLMASVPLPSLRSPSGFSSSFCQAAYVFSEIAKTPFSRWPSCLFPSSTHLAVYSLTFSVLARVSLSLVRTIHIASFTSSAVFIFINSASIWSALPRSWTCCLRTSSFIASKGEISTSLPNDLS